MIEVTRPVRLTMDEVAIWKIVVGKADRELAGIELDGEPLTEADFARMIELAPRQYAPEHSEGNHRDAILWQFARQPHLLEAAYRQLREVRGRTGSALIIVRHDGRQIYAFAVDETAASGLWSQQGEVEIDVHVNLPSGEFARLCAEATHAPA